MLKTTKNHLTDNLVIDNLIIGDLVINNREIQISAIRAQGAGGQNVNKVSTAIHLRFDINASSLPDIYKQRLLALTDKRINKDGIIIIKSQQFRSQEKNKQQAFTRLADIIHQAIKTPTKRKATKPSYGAKQRRLENKTKTSQKKDLRRKITD